MDMEQGLLLGHGRVAARNVRGLRREGEAQEVPAHQGTWNRGCAG